MSDRAAGQAASRAGAAGPLAQRGLSGRHDRERTSDLRRLPPLRPARRRLSRPQSLGRRRASPSGPGSAAGSPAGSTGTSPSPGPSSSPDWSTSASSPSRASGARCSSAPATSARRSTCSSTTCGSGESTRLRESTTPSRRPPIPNRGPGRTFGVERLRHLQAGAALLAHRAVRRLRAGPLLALRRRSGSSSDSRCCTWRWCCWWIRPRFGR